MEDNKTVTAPQNLITPSPPKSPPRVKQPSVHDANSSPVHRDHRPFVDEETLSSCQEQAENIIGPSLLNSDEDDKADDISEAIALGNIELRSDELRHLFRLPSEEALVQDFNCAMQQKKILLQGHMYLFEHYVCFYSNIFGYEKKKVITLNDVAIVRKAKTAGLFPNAIQIIARGKKYFFTSFIYRDEAYNLILERWAIQSPFAKLLVEDQSADSFTSLISDVVGDGQDQCNRTSFESSSDSSLDLTGKQEADICMDDASNHLRACDIGMTNHSIEKTEGSNAAMNISWEIEDTDAPPVPEQYKAVLECELPVSVKDFFVLFFSNDSTEFWERFHQLCGDRDIQCMKWAKHPQSGNVRNVSFLHPIKFPFGPKTTLCEEVQQYRVFRNAHLIIQTSQRMNDIPYGDHFQVEAWWDVVALPSSGADNPCCLVRVLVDVPFSKKTVWKGKIEQGTFDECKKVFQAWLTEVVRVLQERDLTANVTLRSMDPRSAGPSKLAPKVKRKSDGSSEKLNLLYPVQDSLVKEHTTGSYSISLFSIITCLSQKKLMIAITVIAVLLLIQFGIIISYAYSPKIKYIAVDVPCSTSKHYGPYERYGDSQVVIEKSLHFLLEELTIAEAKMEHIQTNINIMRVHLDTLHRLRKVSTTTT